MPKPRDSIVQLDLSNHNQIEAFERAFFMAFSQAKSNQLIRDLWNWSDTDKRLRTRVPYSSQIILVNWDDQGDVDTALALNCSSADFQAGFFGFTAPRDHDAGYEVLTFFSKRDQKIKALKEFFYECALYCDRHNVSWLHATCTQRLLSAYRHFGAEVLATATMSSERRHLIRLNVTEFVKRYRFLAQPNHS